MIRKALAVMLLVLMLSPAVYAETENIYHINEVTSEDFYEAWLSMGIENKLEKTMKIEGVIAGSVRDDALVTKIRDGFNLARGKHPEEFVDAHTINLKTSQNTVTIRIKTELSEDEISSIKESYLIEVQKFINTLEIVDSATDMEKVQAVYKKVMDVVEYRNNTLNDSTGLGALTSGYGSCNGYTSIVNSSLMKLGIDSTGVLGYVNNHNGWELHVWNKVNIDGETYYLDATWGDASADNAKKYFTKSLSEFNKHTLHEAFGN